MTKAPCVTSLSDIPDMAFLISHRTRTSQTMSCHTSAHGTCMRVWKSSLGPRRPRMSPGRAMGGLALMSRGSPNPMLKLLFQNSSSFSPTMSLAGTPRIMPIPFQVLFDRKILGQDLAWDSALVAPMHPRPTPTSRRVRASRSLCATRPSSPSRSPSRRMS